MRTFWVLILAGIMLFGTAAVAQHQHVALGPDDITWGDGPPTIPPGAKMAVLQGNPGQAGPFTVRLKLPADYKIAPHWHPIDDSVTVISGTVYFGSGEKFNTAELKAYPAGSFWLTPAKSPHFVWSKNESIIQVQGIGPNAITYIDSADDPRKK